MKTLMNLLILVFFFGAAPVFAADLVTDAQTGITKYEVEVDAVLQPEVSAEPDGSLIWSVDHLSSGDHTFRARCAGDMWGGAWSDWSAPLPETKPGAPVLLIQ